ncbi:DNA polymerase eta [Anopheles ziemanni]|uniref:DNA polymerase eta n=1 Tax=Anopheles coustani TaxID=139045 RepID=UPI00265B36B7|nr:DNA polymerase eta [Anopheles coustani]XP_058168872.1 DNA polymerase eta [Anopheles ziemanni]
MSTKTNISLKNKFDRVVVLVDMDCFYCQVEEKLTPEIKGKPIAVVQYNPWQGGGIIAVNYPARAKGVTRHMRGDEAKQHCPEIELPQVPQVRGKADLTRYREAGKEVAEVLKCFTPLLERASIDEAYLDITERVLVRIREMNEGKFQLLPDKLVNTFVVGYENIGEFVKKLSNNSDDQSSDKLEYKKSDIKLLVGASIVNEIRAAVKEKTGYECSAGIAHNKILAKLTAGFHKPNKQTILPIDSIPKLYETLPVKKVKGLGGKLGEQVCEVLKIKFMSELEQFPESLLQQHFEERMGSWMYLMARGIDLEAVTAKFHSKSIGCCKRFPGKNAITGLATLTHWLSELATEVAERLEKDLDENNRTAKLLTVSYCQQIDDVDVSSTRSIPLVAYEIERIATDALEAIKRNTDRFLKTNSTTVLNNAIKFLGLSAGKFESNGATKGGGIKEMFQSYSAKGATAEEGPSGMGRRKSSTEPAMLEVLDAAPSATGTSEKIKPKKDIKHFLQQQCKGAIAVCEDEPKLPHSEGETQDTKPVSSATKVQYSDPLAETVKPKKDIKHFLQQQSTAAKKSASEDSQQLKTETVEEKAANPDPDQMKPEGGYKSVLHQSTAKSKDHNIIELKSIHNVVETNSTNHSKREETPTSATYNGNIEPDKNQPVTETKRDETLENSSSTAEAKPQPNYKETYAEFNFIPPVEPAIVTVDCQQCGSKIPENEYISHQDFHFALSLSQQQRDEFRNGLKSKLAAGTNAAAAKGTKSPIPAKRPSKTPSGPATHSSSSGVSIERFLSKTRSIDEGPIIASTSETETHSRCPECGKMIALLAISEHQDYHVAKRLQQELHRLEAPAQPQTGDTASTKRKRPSTAVEEIMLPAKQKVKPVSSYFSKL